MHVRMRSAAGLFIVTLALLGCGGASTAAPSVAQAPASVAASAGAPTAPLATASAAAGAPTAASATTDACALITEAEATTFLGSDPGPGSETGSTDSPACAYDGSMTFAVVTADAKSVYESTKSAIQGSGTAQPLDGVGDEGFVFIVANTIGQVEVLKGSTLLTINIQGDPSKQNVTAARLTDLAKLAVSRL